jgi:hypothetical protein
MFAKSDNIPFEPVPAMGKLILLIMAIAIVLIGILPAFLTRFLDNYVI